MNYSHTTTTHENNFCDESKIINYIIKAGILSKNTTYKRVNLFKECLYYCSADLSNSLFLCAAKQKLSIPTEIIYIHTLMYKFLCNKEQAYIEFTPCTNIAMLDTIPAFTWNISADFMPYLAAYIAATNSTKNTSAGSFFTKWKDFFMSIIQYLRNSSEEMPLISVQDSDRINDTSNNWLNTYLAKEYFEILEDIYLTYSRNETQKDSIRNAVLGINFLVINHEQPHLVIPYAKKLLDTYRKCLSERNSSNKMNKETISAYYPHKEKMKPSGLLKYVQNYADNLLGSVDNFQEFIKEQLGIYHKSTIYGISVTDYDSFSEHCYEYLNQHITPQLQNANSTFYAFTLTLKNQLTDLYNSEYAESVLQEENVQQYIDSYTRIIKKYSEDMEQAFKKFFYYVKIASSENPEQNTKLMIGDNQLDELQKRLAKDKRNLQLTIKNNFNSLNPLIEYSVPGYIKEYSYPVFVFWEKDILRIIEELGFVSADTPKEKVISHLHNSFKFPMSNRNVIDFLLKHDTILSNI